LVIAKSKINVVIHQLIIIRNFDDLVMINFMA